MPILEAIVLGIVQGLTEFLPISSTGHLRIVPAFARLGGSRAPRSPPSPSSGTMAAVLLYFREDLWRIARAGCAACASPRCAADLDARMGWYIVLGTIPIGIFGFAFRDQIENGARDLYLIGTDADRPRPGAAGGREGRPRERGRWTTSGRATGW